MLFESMNPLEHGWFLGQVDEALAGDYDEDKYRALQGVVYKNGDARVLFLDDRLRRAVVKFVNECTELFVMEAEGLGIEQTPTSLAHVVGVMCCLAGVATGMLDVVGEDEEEEE